MDEKILKFAESHEWVHLEGDIAVIGVSEHAQEELGDVVYVESKDVGEVLEQFEEIGSIESVKAVAEIKTPVSGEIVEQNSSLEDSPEKVNSDPYGDGWIVKIKISDESELDKLMTYDKYQEYLGTLQ